MAYFDSPKNQAMWKIELASLKKEREERAKGNYRPQKAVQKVHDADSVHRRRITFAELSEKEAQASGKTRDRSPAMSRSNEIRSPSRVPDMER